MTLSSLPTFTVDVAQKFLDQCYELLEFIVLDKYSSSAYMLGSIEELVSPTSPLQQRRKSQGGSRAGSPTFGVAGASHKTRSYFNDALGMVLESLDRKVDRPLSR
jgi:hypothetical protein